MATHSSTLAWKTPQTEDPGGLSPCGCKESDVTGQLRVSTINCFILTAIQDSTV